MNSVLTDKTLRRDHGDAVSRRSRRRAEVSGIARSGGFQKNRVVRQQNARDQGAVFDVP